MGPSFGFLETGFRLPETSESLWDVVLASGRRISASRRPSGGSWRLDLASGRLDLGSGTLDLGSGGREVLDLGSGTLDLGSGTLDLGSETILGPLFGGFLRVFLWNGDQSWAFSEGGPRRGPKKGSKMVKKGVQNPKKGQKWPFLRFLPSHVSCFSDF